MKLGKKFSNRILDDIIRVILLIYGEKKYEKIYAKVYVR